MQAARQPSFDLILATVGRTDEVGALLDSLQAQTWTAFRVVVVDQNADDRLVGVLSRYTSLSVQRLRSQPGLSRARNAALPGLTGDVVGFPDDDCTYPSGLLEHVAGRLGESALDGVIGRTAPPGGGAAPRWGLAPRTLDREGVWHGGSSASAFLRRSLVERIGGFDEDLGLGAGTRWASGEDTDYLVRALDLGARIEYDPAVVVNHAGRPRAGLPALGQREGAAVGYLLRKHRFGTRTVLRMLTRPLGGAAASFLRLDTVRARFHLATLRGRIAGYRAGAGR